MAKSSCLQAVVETALGAGAAATCALTLVWPDWIERFTGLDPDGGSGETEWSLVLALAAVAAVVLTKAWRDWRRWQLA